MQFKVGDVVFLKSGGTPMTVVEVGVSPTSVYPSGLFRCVWNSLGGHGELIVPPEALRMRDEAN